MPIPQNKQFGTGKMPIPQNKQFGTGKMPIPQAKKIVGWASCPPRYFWKRSNELNRVRQLGKFLRQIHNLILTYNLLAGASE
ncbi:MAG: hypothetical protein EAZ88_19155 [Oscillatoriales cyanobacterium]|nr:MAG: hypothetical protein EAZ94_22255 [Oscillatoriales cyanobacterium]TAE18748.1 MAG: hypothetical protein EAZ93_28860 [Oscillatoriales cyanobacterium]TAE51038.1 MAG: hypothetical protein EAZ88_19155 [Oscillatoriales cyanobacterium]